MKIILFIALLLLVITVYRLYNKELFLASNVKGIVTMNNQPLIGAKITQELVWVWKSKTYNKEVFTDNSGQFSFPLMTGKDFLANILPHEPTIVQTIQVTHNGTTYDAWLYDKYNYRNLSELEGKDINLQCELTNNKDYLVKNEDGSEYFRSPYGVCRLTN